MTTYDENHVRGLFPAIPPPSENPNVIQHVCSASESGMQGVGAWVLVILEEDDTAWDPRDPNADFEGPLRVTYWQYVNGKIAIGSVEGY